MSNDSAQSSELIDAWRKSGQSPCSGCVCLAGDCQNCLATIDGIAYVRTCQAPHLDSASVRMHAGPHDLPPLESTAPAVSSDARTIHCDVVVIGQGPAGRSAADLARQHGHHVVTMDSGEGQDAIGIYPGPLVVARTANGMLHAYPRIEIIVATGAAEIHPVAPGSDLRGLVTSRAASALRAAGIDLGRVAAIGTPPDGLACEHVPGALVRFEPAADDPNRVGVVVTRSADGDEIRTKCDTVSLGLGLVPRDALLRMARGTNVRGVGDVLLTPDLPPPPIAGIVCACLGTTVDDLRSVHARGFCELELVKRATLAGTGPCQGSACVPHIRAFLAAEGAALQPPFTARPLTRQITLGEIAAGAHHAATPRTALDAEHRALGAHMERLGGWWRPWNYGDVAAEYHAVRNAVSLCDVSTLGKMQISGPDAVRLLEHLYPLPIASLKIGRSRYVLLLNERGYVMDDGMVCRDAETRFTLTFTSGGSTFAELWVRDWAEALSADVRIMNQTMSLGAINVTGPLAKELMRRAGVENPPAFLHHTEHTVAGILCRVFRLSFTGEASFELHHAAADSVELWQRLMTLGRDLGIRPHGLEALMTLRLEKGHIIIGQDSDFDSTPRRLNHEWAVQLKEPSFVGRHAVMRTNAIPLDRQLCGFQMAGPPPPEGATIWRGSEFAGFVTSAAWSPALNASVILGWLRLSEGVLVEDVTINDRPARRVPTPFFDPEGARARA